MATVRIYKVAELLGTTSQEVTALLKRDHGIEVKSASSTIEEVVARQFVDRLARQRSISLPSGDIFVSDGYGNNRVVHFDGKGGFVNAWGRRGSGPGEFNLPHAITVDSKGRLYVADRSNARVQVFDQNGTFLEQWRNVLVPWSLWITPQDEIWTSGSSPTLTFDSRGMTGIPPAEEVEGCRSGRSSKVSEHGNRPVCRGLARGQTR